MKYLAILHDSFREAIDSKVLPIMLVLSGLLMLAAASLSFQPLSFEELETKRLFIGSLNRVRTFSGQQPSDPFHGFFQIQGVEALDGGTPGPDKALHVTLSARYKNPQEARAMQSQVRDFIAANLGLGADGKVFEVNEVQPAQAGNPLLPKLVDDKDLYFEATTRPTAWTLRLWPHHCTFLFGAVPLDGMWKAIFGGDAAPGLGVQVWAIEDNLVGGFGAWVALLISVVVTSFFIPNMIRKGTADLLLVKPIHRSTLLIYKYLGGLTFIILNATVAVAGVWLVLGLRSGIWSPYFLLMVVVITLFFAILYAVSTLVAVWTRSAIGAIVATMLAWFVFYAIGRAQLFVAESQQKESTIKLDERLVAAIRTAHFLLPRPKDLDYLTTRLLTADLLPAQQAKELPMYNQAFNWGESLLVSSLFIVVLLALSCWRFAKLDY